MPRTILAPNPTLGATTSINGSNPSRDGFPSESTPGDYVDQSYVQAAIAEALEFYSVEKIGFDPWNATKLITDLQNDGVGADRFVKVRQGVPSLGEATKDFEKLVFAGLLDHGGHPVLRWMAQNALVRFDRNMNFAPDKLSSREILVGRCRCADCSVRPAGQGRPHM